MAEPGTPIVNDAAGREDERVGALRGASIGADGRRITRALLVLCLVAVSGLAIGLFVAGIEKNNQINDLRDRGVAVEVRVTSCRGLLGGSGSNPVGYTCQGSEEMGGRSYTVTLPDAAMHEPGSSVRFIAAKNDPGLLATAAAVARDRASGRVFILPSVFVLVDAAAVTLLVVRWRRASALPRGGHRGRPEREPGGV